MATQIIDFPERTASVMPAPSDEFADIDLLHSISVALIGEQDRVELYGKIVDAAVAITGSQFGTMQLLTPAGDPSGHGGELQLLAHRGLPPEAVGFWQWVSPAAYSSCTQALKFGQRAIIPDFETWADIAGTEDLDAFRRTGIRAAQTTPLLSRTGTLLGMISTHWDRPHQPSERDLRLLDILARQAADLLERTIADEALRDSEALQKLLTGELSHRVKNMLATVQAIASQTLRHSSAPEAFVASFDGRIQSMSRVHSQLSTNEWKGTQLRDVVQDQMKLGPVDDAQISATGPDVYLDAGSVPNMAMILHELGTNSLKYGALSRLGGKVSIDWSVAGATLNLCWSETGGPKVVAPIRRGFGTRLIEASVRGAGGDAKMAVAEDGVRWTIAMRLHSSAAAKAPAPEPVTLAARNLRVVDGGAGHVSPLAGKRLLVVEDEPLLAMDIAGQLEDAGAAVIGPAADASVAVELIEQYRLDGALLDANLDGAPVDDIAAALTRAGIPFVFVTGYGKESLPAAFATNALLPKPFNGTQLIGAAQQLVA